MMERSRIFRDDLLAGQRALVTGGGTGIGRVIALELARVGADVALLGRRQEPLEAVAAEIAALGRRACATPADIRDPGQVEAAVETVCESLGGLDLLVNNAGGQFPSPAEGISPNGWRAVVETNLTGTFLVTREVARRALLPQRSGAIVNVVVDMSRGLPGAAHSGAARAGVENLTRSLAVEWGPHNIRVNAIAPGAVRTLAVAEAYPEDVVALLRRITPLGRMGEPEEVAWLVAYLASEAGAYITGATIPLDGGSRLWGTAWNLLPGREGSGGS